MKKDLDFVVFSTLHKIQTEKEIKRYIVTYVINDLDYHTYMGTNVLYMDTLDNIEYEMLIDSGIDIWNYETLVRFKITIISLFDTIERKNINLDISNTIKYSDIIKLISNKPKSEFIHICDFVKK